MTQHPAFAPGRTAVITGGASGIGLAAARRLLGMGLKVVVADLAGDALERTGAELATLGEARAVACDVSRPEEVLALRAAAFDAFGEVAVLMNNAGVGSGGGPFADPARWRRVLETNLWGAINGVQAFVPAMIEQGTPCAVINTGSKQGITTPPGDLAYNVSKAGLKAFTEGLAHELRTTAPQVSAHLLIPGFTFTGLTRAAEKPAAAWTGEQVVDFMLESLGRGDFYVLSPDNAVPREVDEKRIRWAADDLILNRPALSRWDPRYEAEFAAFMAG